MFMSPEKYSDVKSLMHDVFRNQRLVFRTTGGNNNVPLVDPSGYQTGTGIAHKDEVTEHKEE